MRHLMFAIGAVVALGTPVAHARTEYALDFDAAIACDATPGARGSCFDRADIGPSYGDVPGIVDVRFDGVVDGVPSPMNWWSTGYNDLVGVAFGNGGSDDFAKAEVVIEALDGHGITLLGFDLGAWLNAKRRSQWTILDYGTGEVLARTRTANDPLIDIGTLATPGNPSRSTRFEFDLFSPTGIVIQWGPGSWFVGIDNIRFQAGAFPPPPVVIPEPSTTALWALGALVTAIGLRRRSRSR
jgi:hypothetical protein